MQKLDKKLDTVEVFESVMNESSIDHFMQRVINTNGVYELRFTRGLFDGRSQYNQFISSITSFNKNLESYYVNYCNQNNLEQKLKEFYISIKGYYVTGEDIIPLRNDRTVISIYVELKPVTNRNAVAGLYHWEEKFNELRTGIDTDGLHETP
ncbi:hypothetical protein ABE178_16170 [Priestia megaterium]